MPWRDQALEELSASVEAARRVGASQLHTFSDGIGPGGVIRKPPPLRWEARYQSCVEGLEEAAKLVEGTGITLVVEAINNIYVPGYFWDEVGITLAICRAVDHPQVRLAFDCFHQQLSGGRLTDHLREALAWMTRFDVADVPGRGQPGTGEINFAHLSRVLETEGLRRRHLLRNGSGGGGQRWSGPSVPRGIRVLTPPTPTLAPLVDS